MVSDLPHHFFSGQKTGQIIVVMSELVGVDNLASCLGFYELFAAVGFLIGSSFSGTVF